MTILPRATVERMRALAWKVLGPPRPGSVVNVTALPQTPAGQATILRVLRANPEAVRRIGR